MGRKPPKQKKKWQEKGWWRVQPGRKLGQLSGNKALMNRRKHSGSEIHARLVHGSAEWQLVRLLELLEDEKQKLRNDEEAKARFKKEVEKDGTLPRHFLRDFLGAIRNAVEQYQLARPKAPPATQLVRQEKNYPRKGMTVEELRKWAESRNRILRKYPRKEVDLEELRRWAESGPNQTVMEIYSLTRDLHAELDDAVEKGDADWFERMARAIQARERLATKKDKFDAAVVRVFEDSIAAGAAARAIITQALLESMDKNVETEEAKREKLRLEEKREKVTRGLFTTALPPAGKQVNFTGKQQVLDKLGAVELKRPHTIGSARKYVLVCGREFPDMRRAREAVEAVRKRFGYKLKNSLQRIDNPQFHDRRLEPSPLCLRFRPRLRLSRDDVDRYRVGSARSNQSISKKLRPAGEVLGSEASSLPLPTLCTSRASESLYAYARARARWVSDLSTQLGPDGEAAFELSYVPPEVDDGGPEFLSPGRKLNATLVSVGPAVA